MSKSARSVLASFAVVLGFLYEYFYLLLAPELGHRQLVDRHIAIASGTAHAPDQYRYLAPWLSHHLAQLPGLPLHRAILLVDSVALLAGVGLLVVLLRARGFLVLALPVTLYVAAFGVAILQYPRPETPLTFLAVCMVGVGLAVDHRLRQVWLAGGVLFLAGTRPDMAVLSAGAFAVMWWQTRRPGWLLAAVGSVIVGGGSLWLAVQAYPHATYDTATVQLLSNLNPVHWLVPVLFFAPLLLVADRALLRDWLPVIAWLGLVVAATLVMGRVNEVRIFFPFAGLVGIIVAESWLPERLAVGSLEVRSHAAR